jgi:hypothetical protein
MISASTNGQETTEGRSVRDIVEHEHGQVNDAWCRKLVRQLLQSLERQYAMDMPHRAITADTVVFHQNGEPLLLPSIVSDPAPAEADDLTALAKLIHYAITQELMPEGPLHGRGLDGYSEALLTAVDRCMDPDPARRPQSIAALRAILGIVAPGLSPLPPPPALAELADPVPAFVPALEAALEPALEAEPAPEPAPDRVPHQAPPVPVVPAAPLTAATIPDTQPPAPAPAPAPAARAAQQPAATVPTQALRASADSTSSPTAPPAAPTVQPPVQPTSPPPDETAQSNTIRRPRWAVPVGIAAAVLAVLLAAYARLHDSTPPADSMPAQTVPGSQTQADTSAPPPPAPAADGTVPTQPDQPQQAAQSQDGSPLTAPMTASTTPPPATTTPAGPAAAPARTAPTTGTMIGNNTGNSMGNSAGNTAGNAASPAGTAPAANPNAGATYRLQIQPWGTVYVDGIDRGVSPPVKRVQLSPGRHTVRVTNPNYHERVLDIDTANGDGRIVVDFGNAE